MLPRIAFSAALIAALLVVPAAAHAAAVVQPSSVATTALLSPGRTHTVSLVCPSPSVALNAAVTGTGPGVRVRRSSPGSEAGTWRLRVAVGPGGSRRVRAVLRCVRLDLPSGVSGARLGTKTRRQFSVAVPAGGTASVRLRCGPAWLATGYGLERGTSDDVRLAEVVPSAHGWDFVLENTGHAAVRAGVSARCLKQTVTASRDGGTAQLRFRITRPTFPFVLTGGGSPTILQACGAGAFSLATGSRVEAADPIELFRSAPVRARGGSWTFRRADAGDTGQVSLVCLSRGSVFH